MQAERECNAASTRKPDLGNANVGIISDFTAYLFGVPFFGSTAAEKMISASNFSNSYLFLGGFYK